MRKIQQQTIETVLQQMNKVLIRTREPFIEQYQHKSGNVGWIQRKYKLTDNIIRSHIKGERTVGTFYFGNATIFLFFDIDAEGDIQGQKSRVKAIIYELKKYGINEEDIHVMFSGCKGYHVQLFFDNPVPIKRVANLGKKILHSLGKLAEGIELRPENINGRGIKLPLAYHKKTKESAYYVEKERLELVPDSINYFLQITPFNYEIIENACDMALSNKNGGNQAAFKEPKATSTQKESKLGKCFTEMKLSFHDTHSLEKRAKQLLEKGLRRKGLRHEAQFILALYYKGQSISCKKAVQEISDWVVKQWKNKKTSESSLEFLKQEVKRNIEYVYKKKDYTGLYCKRGKNLIINHQDIVFIKKQEKKNIRKVLLALLMIGRIYHVDGRFSADMLSIGRLAGLSRQTVSIILKELMIKGIVEQIVDYTYSEGLARTYFMPYLRKKYKKDSGIIEFEELTLSEAFWRVFELIEGNVKVF
ncbi:hypothetical protein OIU11_01960 [Bacillus cereus]|uniref:TOTE conflict system archaeo-eukaryotic primase domain-containing protein n=1 Tax=Bacillus cereus TaxID=1396 RepID=UPI002227FA0E|nr:hypothetical protein [Bacillus cereus]UYY94323.1 hypothetical protein OIU11_01960 [Bacillus cereus]